MNVPIFTVWIFYLHLKQVPLTNNKFFFTTHRDDILCCGMSYVGMSDHSVTYIPTIKNNFNFLSFISCRQVKHLKSNFAKDISARQSLSYPRFSMFQLKLVLSKNKCHGPFLAKSSPITQDQSYFSSYKWRYCLFIDV